MGRRQLRSRVRIHHQHHRAARTRGLHLAALLVRADSPIAEPRDLERKTLVSTTGTTPLKTITQLNRERLLGVNIGDVPDHARGIEMVEKGEADAFLMDEVLLIGLVATRPDPAMLKVVTSSRWPSCSPKATQSSNAWSTTG
jgi:hypothetical protein